VSGLPAQIEASIRSRQLLRRGQPVLVAAAGGLDSMVLLHVLHGLAARHRWRLVVAHFNHQLRGRSSDADERLVRQTARRHKLRCVVGRADVKAHARAHKLSLEMAARELRHQFLARTARARGIRTIALAHHADDQVELFFLRLLRGAGSEGLAGMKWRSPSPADPQIALVRPLLDQPKQALAGFADQARIPFRTDASNAALDIQRNRVRHELLPWLRAKYQPALDRLILRQMELLGAEADFLERLAAAWRRAKSRAAFNALPVALQRRVLQFELLSLGVVPEFDLIESLREGESVTVGPSLQLRRDTQGVVRRRRVEAADFERATIRLPLNGTVGGAEFGGLSLRWQTVRKVGVRLPKRLARREWFDADKVGSPVILRHWRPGDRFQPIGMASAVKLQDLFTNAKVPRAERRRRVVATTASGEIWWVEGLRLGERFKLAPQTRRRLEWRWSRTGAGKLS
jgi:tRNA(Ile)-lysidine synthase